MIHPKICLMAVSGAGKTTLSKILAHRQGGTVIDADEEIEKYYHNIAGHDDSELFLREMHGWKSIGHLMIM